jgi:hypothetical protein
MNNVANLYMAFVREDVAAIDVENDGTSYTVGTDDGHTNHESHGMLRCLRPSSWTSSLRQAERNDESEPGAPPREALFYQSPCVDSVRTNIRATSVQTSQAWPLRY